MLLSEVENYTDRIHDLRGQVTKLIAGLPQEALDWRPLPAMESEAGAEQAEGTTNSLAVLAAHIAGAEHFWIGEVVGALPPSRDRDAEFTVQGLDATQLVARLGQTAAETREVLGGLQPADLDEMREVDGHTFPVRWCILHVIDHTALHLGHMQLTYQLWMGGRGVSSPFWYERLRTSS
jgi:uncharacterized damage-inducible protein DinB